MRKKSNIQMNRLQMVANPQIGSSWRATTCLLDLFFRKEKVRKGEKEVEQVKVKAVREK